MIEGKTKIWKFGTGYVINVPVSVLRDSTFPLKVGERVCIKIEKKKLVIG